ncbi:pilus assembly protein CpaB [Brevibacillus fulvus]|uniref:Pilus assembly protein CpaB n=1 Tax=Brevibacillus fulvus TaxID=1125967 RepID=A0A938Y1H1_9BACL|nr:pilus assembly protein CpaB [Brevibacillus fulvus]MBM7592194.1 pilus assembly protein CpaB [Brevibacillus fulvus]
MTISPIRLVAALLLAVCLGCGAYMILKPQTFHYLKLREGEVVEAGTLLKEEQIEQGVLVLGSMFAKQSTPLPNLIPWEEAESYLALPLSRQVAGPMPLFVNDFAQQDEKGLSQLQDETWTGMSIPVDNIIGVTPYLEIGDYVHLFASFEDEEGAHSGLLFKNMPVVALQRELDGEIPRLVAVTIAVKLDEAVLLTHAIHYGKIHLAKAALVGEKRSGIGDSAFAQALMRTKKRWSSEEEPE